MNSMLFTCLGLFLTVVLLLSCTVSSECIIFSKSVPAFLDQCKRLSFRLTICSLRAWTEWVMHKLNHFHLCVLVLVIQALILQLQLCNSLRSTRSMCATAQPTARAASSSMLVMQPLQGWPRCVELREANRRMNTCAANKKRSEWIQVQQRRHGEKGGNERQMRKKIHYIKR